MKDFQYTSTFPKNKTKNDVRKFFIKIKISK